MLINEDYEFIRELLKLERTPLVEKLMEVIRDQNKLIEQLKQEIAELKKKPKRPKIKPNTLPVIKKPTVKKIEESTQKSNKEIIYHEEVTLYPEYDTRDCIFKGYRYYHVQDIAIELRNKKFKIPRWRTKQGEYLPIYLPAGYEGYHFGPTLRAYILHQYHHQSVTQPLLLEQLREWGLVISAGELNSLLNAKKEEYHEEKKNIFLYGVKEASYLHVDDTGARHKGKNHVCTHIGNENFACFFTTRYKNHTNFLKLLHTGVNLRLKVTYGLMDELCKKGLEGRWYEKFGRYMESNSVKPSFDDTEEFIEFLKKFVDRSSLLEKGLQYALKESLKKNCFFFPEKMTFISDDAGQFQRTGYAHGLCWIHAERKLKDLIPENDEQRACLNEALEGFWNIYRSLVYYKDKPDKELKKTIKKSFDDLMESKGSYHLLNKVLHKLNTQKDRLLRVLVQPEIPLHNNLSERDIREFVKRRKISGGTRSEQGRESRDTFASLKKTCKKLKIGFWSYLLAKETKNSEHKSLACLVLSKYY